ncbi:hypothetical protein BS50DRAFT_651153 [Corynespora cassiicola Philippines]|uniref:Glycoside hydrolase family 43 protein n=1 Tax=Corynespora cassiicola Philippines TaxID=1448308 RepID=A0A2T2N8L4_CORCC|nr:hypothetical protein BS50DRAFT_651153 [Corynespora cassiicola Philippines]
MIWKSVFVCGAAFVSLASGQDDLGLGSGYTDFDVGDLRGQLVKASQTLASLNSSRSGFNFLPTDFLANLTHNGAHHLGDVTFRYRTSGSGAWTSVDSANARRPVVPLSNLTAGIIAGADISPTLGNRGLPFRVTREWLPSGDTLALRINFTNTGDGDVEFGSLGLPISINNIFTGRPAEETQERCSFADPYIGLDAGYVRVSHLQGTGNALVIAPLGSTPFEAWRFLEEPGGDFWYWSQTYEGTYEWQIHSLAYAQNEWTDSTPWNTPTSKILTPGESYSVGVRFALADSIQTIEDAVVKTGTPLAIGIPGYVIPQDLTAKLYLNYSSPVAAIDAENAFEITAPAQEGAPYSLVPSSSAWGRQRVTITYEDGKKQTVHYFITKSASSTLADLGHFFTTSAHYTNENDPFGRAPSIMSYDRETNSVVEQDGRVWIAGLSDEGGTGAYLATAMKEFIQPVAEELSVVDDFIHDTIVGTLQRNGSFGVSASAFFYEPGAVDYSYDPNINWGSWTSWNRERAYTTRRAYNYIHPTAAYWTMYRVARDYPAHELRAEWSWYLGRAYNTTQFCLSNEAANCDYGLVGLMGEWVLGELLEDLKREGMSAEVAALEETMRFRAELWETQAVPFGSEMAWDSTGQEGVYYWTNYFNLTTTATKAINSVLAYMPAVAHWGWNGNARRYWDFIYGAKIQQYERQIHHYGSGLNSLPLLSHFEQNPTDVYSLRVAYAGNTAPLSNIDEEGFASAAFHSYPELLKWDPYSGDYGQGFLGLSLGQGVYIVNDPRLGDLVFGGNVVDEGSGDSIAIEPRDAVRKRVFVAQLGLKVEISAGAIEKVVFNKAQGTLNLSISVAVNDAALKADRTVIWLKKPGSSSAVYTVEGLQEERGGWVADLTTGTVNVQIVKA